MEVGSLTDWISSLSTFGTERCIAAAAAGIWGTYLTMARNPPVCATA